MKVYVTSVVYRYPEEDGPGFIAGVYLSETKANETKDKYRELDRSDLDPHYGTEGLLLYILENNIMKYCEIKKFVKDHKTEIIWGTLGVVGTGVLIVLGVKGIRSVKNVDNPVEMIGGIVDDNWKDNNVVEGFTTGKVNDLWNEDSYGNAIVQFFKIKDMGDLGEDLKKIGGITDDTEVSAVLSFINNMETWPLSF